MTIEIGAIGGRAVADARVVGAAALGIDEDSVGSIEVTDDFKRERVAGIVVRVVSLAEPDVRLGKSIGVGMCIDAQGSVKIHCC
jgi:hypothetical protein